MKGVIVKSPKKLEEKDLVEIMKKAL